MIARQSGGVCRFGSVTGVFVFVFVRVLFLGCCGQQRLLTSQQSVFQLHILRSQAFGTPFLLLHECPCRLLAVHSCVCAGVCTGEHMFAPSPSVPSNRACYHLSNIFHRQVIEQTCCYLPLCTCASCCSSSSSTSFRSHVYLCVSLLEHHNYTPKF